VKTLIEDLGRDAAYSLRALRQQPVFAVAVVGILALAIGGQTAMFSLVDATLLRRLPYRDPGALVTITHETGGSYSTSLPFPLVEAFRRNARGLQAVAAYYQNTGISRVTLTGRPEPESVKAGFVSADLFQVLGVAPSLGRVFDAAEEAAGERVVVLGHRLWQRQLGGSTDVLGASIQIDGAASIVVGVMPETFQFPDRSVELWVPLTTNRTWRRDAEGQAHYWWIGLGRLAPGLEPAAVEAELDALAAASGAQPKVERIRVRRLDTGVSAASRLTLWTLFGAVGAILLIACSNLATLLMARGEMRRRELAVRAAVGAGRGRLVRQLLSESLVLATLAGGLGVLLAELLLRLFLRLGPGDVPRLEQARVDPRALLFLAGCTWSTVLLFGLLPALRSTDSLHASARDAAGDPRSGRLRTALASLQVALALVLLSTAGLLLRSFLAAGSVELGFEPERALVVRSRLALEEPGARRTAYYTEVLRRLAAVPGVEAAGAINDLFELNRVSSLTLRAIEGRAEDPQAPRLPLKWTAVSGDYFRAVGARLLEGRAFGEQDTAASPRIVIVDQSFARRFFPGASALGRRFKGQDPRGRDDEWLTIVGVVGDMRREGLERQPSPHVYECAEQSGDSTPDLVVRTRANPLAMAAALRAAVRGADATAVVSSIGTLESALLQQLDRRRFESALLTAFATCALTLAALGLFALVHYSAARRAREVGVRQALGATASDVVVLFLKQAATPILAGGAAGLLGALAVARGMGAMVFGISPFDLPTHAAALVALSAAALGASLIPALGAARRDPLLALRQD